MLWGQSRTLNLPVSMALESLHKTFALALKYDRLIDVHCDEIDDEQSRFVLKPLLH